MKRTVIEINRVQVSDLIKFLDRKEALSKFVRNIIRNIDLSAEMVSKPILNTLLAGTKAETLIGGHFVWGAGTEGDWDYWHALDKEWNQFLRDNDVDPDSVVLED